MPTKPFNPEQHAEFIDSHFLQPQPFAPLTEQPFSANLKPKPFDFDLQQRERLKDKQTDDHDYQKHL